MVHSRMVSFVKWLHLFRSVNDEKFCPVLHGTYRIILCILTLFLAHSIEVYVELLGIPFNSGHW